MTKQNRHLTKLILLLSVTLLNTCDTKSLAAKNQLKVNQLRVAGNITKDTKWTADKEYLMLGQVFVKAGATLTIEPGTTIKSIQSDLNGQAPVLVIEQGAKIIADGTAKAPITFTSALDEKLLPARGTWGGVVILGKAPINKDDGQGFIEGLAGIPYGGKVSDDNSGILRYVRIWYGGRKIGKDNELNGLTFGGVGNKTTVEYCEVAWNQDDAFEFFGGTVNVKYLSALFGADDSFDTDQGYTGKGQFLFTVLGHDSARGFEMDNDAKKPDITPRSSPKFSNVTIIGLGKEEAESDKSKPLILLRRGTGGEFRNLIATGGEDIGVSVDKTSIPLIGQKLIFSPNNIVFTPNGPFNKDSATLLTARNVDPMLRSLPADQKTGLIDPRPGEGSPALTSGDKLPEDGFFTQVNYSGAFGGELWLKDWSWLDSTKRLP